MSAGYSSGTPVSLLMTAHAIGAMRGRADRRLYRGVLLLLGILMDGVGEETESSLLSGGMR